MIKLHVIEKPDSFYIYKHKSCKHEKLKEKEYVKEKHFGFWMCVIAFLCDFYPKFNFWNSGIIKGNGNSVLVSMNQK